MDAALFADSLNFGVQAVVHFPTPEQFLKKKYLKRQFSAVVALKKTFLAVCLRAVQRSITHICGRRTHDACTPLVLCTVNNPQCSDKASCRPDAYTLSRPSRSEDRALCAACGALFVTHGCQAS